MTKFSEMTTAQMREAKAELIRRLRDTLQPTRITSLTDRGVYLDGGQLPGKFDADTGELAVWGRASRGSGGEITVTQLEMAEDVLIRFYAEYVGDDPDEEIEILYDTSFDPKPKRTFDL